MIKKKIKSIYTHGACVLIGAAIVYFIALMFFEYEKNWVINFAQETIQKRPRDPESWLILGTSYYKRKKYDEAFMSYQKALELDPSYAATYMYMGIYYIDYKKDTKDGIKWLKKSFLLAPTKEEVMRYIELFNKKNPKSSE